MMSLKHLSYQAALYIVLFVLTMLTIIPVTVFADYTVVTKSVSSTPRTAYVGLSLPAPTIAINPTSLAAGSGVKPSIIGTSTSAVKKVRVVIADSTTHRTLYKSSSTSVKNGTWSIRSSKSIADGSYAVSVYDVTKSSKLIASGTLIVGAPPAMLRVTPIPLLAGGSTGSNSQVPISYLQILNTGTATTSIKGFWVRQDGSAPTASVIGFSSVDDRGLNRTQNGGTEGAVVFTNGLGYVPSTATLAPGERRLFTLKAQLSGTAGRYAGTALMLNVTGIDSQAAITAAFPIIGATWMLRAY